MINRRQFLAKVPAGAASLSAATRLASAAVVRNGRPNILFMIADDLTFRALDSTVKRQVKTPNLDKLASSGCTFTHCFQQGGWTGAICVPSRTMLNTGLTTFNARKAIPDNQSFEHPTWGQTFRAAGYETFITGKWHLDAVSLNRSFEHQVCVGPGYLPSTPDMYNRPAPGNRWNAADTSLAGHWLHTELWRNKKPDTIQHSSSVYAESAIEFLRTRNTKSARSFFMYVGFNAPHDPRQAPQQYLDMYPEESIELPPNYIPQHPFDQGMARDRDELLAPFPRKEEDVRAHRREYYAIISHMDAEVGRILAALEATGEAQNTYVIFTADHGLAVGEHGLMGKQNQYECSMHMPLLMRGPGIAAGKRVDHLVYQHCMYATTCDLVGLPVPPHVEFQSVAPMLRENQAKPIYDSVFGWLTNLQRSVRTSRYRMIFYPPLNRYQLFDLEVDPWELKDLADSPEFAATLDDMKAQLRKNQLALGDTLVAKS